MAVEFNDENQLRAAQMYAQLQQGGVSNSKMEQWLMNKGVAGTPQQAKMVLVGIAIVFFAASAFVIYKTHSGPKRVSSFKPQELPNTDPGSPNYRPQ